MSLPVRHGRRPRRRPVSRASTPFTRTRFAAGLALLLSGAGLYGLTTSPAFAVDPGTVTVEGLRYTDPAAVRAAAGLQDGIHHNLFHVPTARLAAALMSLPTVRSAVVEARLPDALRIVVEERAPILSWRRDGGDWLVDVEGVVLAPAPPAEPLPVVNDRRAAAPMPSPGMSLDALDLEIARVLAAVTPADLGSDARSLDVTLEDEHGWVLTREGGWRAAFGHFVPTSRPPSQIPALLTCLRALLTSEEGEVASVTLSLSDDACGTYLPRREDAPPPDPSTPRGDRPASPDP